MCKEKWTGTFSRQANTYPPWEAPSPPDTQRTWGKTLVDIHFAVAWQYSPWRSSAAETALPDRTDNCRMDHSTVSWKRCAEWSHLQGLLAGVVEKCWKMMMVMGMEIHLW